jgi:hypothetical protein
MIHFVGISTVVCGSFWGVEQIQNGGHCHGNQGIKLPPNTKILQFGPTPQKLPHTTVDISKKFHEV